MNNKRVQTLANALADEVNETSDVSPVVTVSRRNLHALLVELLPKEGHQDDE